ncbi:hypothetical protein FRB90_005383, partial [Tulasnella sp. 427]
DPAEVKNGARLQGDKGYIRYTRDCVHAEAILEIALEETLKVSPLSLITPAAVDPTTIPTVDHRFHPHFLGGAALGFQNLNITLTPSVA